MKTENYVGNLLKSLAKCSGIHRGGYRVFLLDGKDDDTGKLIAADFSVRGILRQHPELSGAKVKYAKDYCGEIILRVWWSAT